MRTRFKTKPMVIYSGSREYCWDNDPPVTTYYDSYITRWTPQHEVIWDDPSRTPLVTQDGMALNRFKPCYHVVWRYVPQTRAIQVGWGDGINCKSDPMRLLNNIYMSKDGSSWPTFNPDLDLGERVMQDVLSVMPKPFTGHYDRWLRRKPTLTSRANLSVFLGELADCKRMFRLLPRKHFGKDNWSQFFTDSKYPVSEMDAGSLLRWANGLHLNYNFGWKPFISEFVKAADALQTFEKRLDRFLSDQGKTLSRGTADPEQTDTQVYQYQPVGSSFRLDLEVNTVSKLSSAFTYSYDSPYGQDELFVRAYADNLGLSIKPSVFWQLIPYTFLVDWVYDVTGMLDANSSNWVEPGLTWYQACALARCEANGFLRLVKVPSPSATFTIGYFTVRYFHRMLGIPNFHLEARELTADKIRLAASLLAARA